MTGVWSLLGRGDKRVSASEVVSALRAAADLLERCPIRRQGLLGPPVSVEQLRLEADHIERYAAQILAELDP